MVRERECEKREVDLSSSSACVSPASAKLDWKVETGLRGCKTGRRKETTIVSFHAKVFIISYVDMWWVVFIRQE